MLEAVYSEVRLIHIAAVTVSGGLFCLRSLLINVFDSPWAMAPPVRRLSYVIDSVLLAAALALTTIIHQYPGTHLWLTTKVALLVVYIGLGHYALKLGRTRRGRIVFTFAAAAVFAFIVTIARSHHPLGVFARLA